MGGMISLSSIFTTAAVPGGSGSLEELAELPVSARLGMAHPELKSTSRATGLPRNEQVLRWALTKICEVACARASSGLAASISALKSGK